MLEAEACGVAGTAIGHADAWAHVRGRLKADLGEEVFSCWFAGMNVEQIEGGTVWLSVPSRFLKTWISTHYRDKLAALWQAEGVLLIARSRYRCGRPCGPGLRRQPGSRRRKPRAWPARQCPVLPRRVRSSAEAASARLFDDISSPLDPRYTFDNFRRRRFQSPWRWPPPARLPTGRPQASSSIRSISIRRSARERRTSCRRSPITLRPSIRKCGSST